MDRKSARMCTSILSAEKSYPSSQKKIKMRAGETDKAVSFKDPELFTLIEKFVDEAGYRGQIDIDIFEINGEYYISEVTRFGVDILTLTKAVAII